MLNNQVFLSLVLEVSKLPRKDIENLLVQAGIYAPGELDHEEYAKIIKKQNLVEKVFSEKDEFDVVDALIKHGILSKKILDELRLGGYGTPDFENRAPLITKSSTTKIDTKKRGGSVPNNPVKTSKKHPIQSGESINKVGQYLLGTISLLLLTIFFYILISLNLLGLPTLIDFINGSGSSVGDWTFSVILASGGLTVLSLFNPKIGAQIGIAKIEFNPVSENVGRYLFGLAPLGTLAIFLLASIIFLVDSQNCESPIAEVNVKAAGTLPYDYDGRNLVAPPGARLTLEAVPVTTVPVLCEWTSSGQSIKGLSHKSDCTTQLNLSDQAGSNGLVTLTLSRKFCPARSTSVIEVKTQP